MVRGGDVEVKRIKTCPCLRICLFSSKGPSLLPKLCGFSFKVSNDCSSTQNIFYSHSDTKSQIEIL